MKSPLKERAYKDDDLRSLPDVVKKKAMNLKTDVKGSELFPDDIGNILDEFDRDY